MIGTALFLAQSLLNAGAPQAWKWDVDIYDRPGWSTPWIGGPKLIGDEILIQCVTHPEDIYYDDWYAEVSETVTLSSTDGGLTWKETSNERFIGEPTNPADDIMVDVSTRSALTDEGGSRKKTDVGGGRARAFVRHNARQRAIGLANLPRLDGNRTQGKRLLRV